MENREPDFTGWATVYSVVCDDQKKRVITPGAFDHQDGQTVPLMFQHNHKDPEMIIGHALLHSVPDMGIACDGFLNDSTKADACRKAANHHDVVSLSIWADQLEEDGNKVCHGVIREVSIVLAGANPEARIDYTSLHHSGISDADMYSDAVIYSGITFDYDDDDEYVEHSEMDDEDYIEHAAQEDDPEVAAFIESNPTVDDLIAEYNTLSDEEMDVMNAVLVESNKGDISDESLNEFLAMIDGRSNVSKLKLVSLVTLAKKDE